MTESGFRGATERDPAEEEEVEVGICIWHLTNSMGVKRRLVNAPLTPPQMTSPENGNAVDSFGPSILPDIPPPPPRLLLTA